MREQNNPRRVLIVYHGAGDFGARKIFEALSACDQVRLRVLGPRRGYYPLAQKICRLDASDSGRYDIVTGRVFRAMRDFSNPYLSGFLREMLCFRPDIVHVFNEAYSGLHFQALLYRSLLRPTAKCYCNGAQNVIPPTAATRWERQKRRFANRHSDGAACWGTRSLVALRDAGFPADKLKLTYWGIPLDRFKPARNPELRQRLGLDDSFVVGFVGRIELQKGLWTLLLAMRQLPGNVSLLCLGNGRWQGVFDRKVVDFGLSGRVRRLDEVPGDQVPDYINAMDVLVMPSETTLSLIEQFGRVLPEAMACEVPVVGSDSGAIPEVIGDAGIVFAERDFAELADCIRCVAADPLRRRELGRAGRARAERLFSCEAYAARLLSMYGIGLAEEKGSSVGHGACA